VHALGAADLLIGRAIERSLEAHHRYRLRELTPSSRKIERLLGPMDAVVVDA
jgi:hypothetical protein